MSHSPLHRPLDVRDIPALLGVDPQRSRWTLWHILSGRYCPEDDPDRVPPLQETLHDKLVEHIRTHQLLGVPARRPTQCLTHPELPLTGAPDLVIDSAPEYGPGFGFALVVALSAGEWRRRWRGTRPTPSVPYELQACAQAMFLLCNARWGLVLPQIGWGKPHAPLFIEPNPAVSETLCCDIEAFIHSIAENTPPAPDARADHACLHALSHACPNPWPEPTTLDPELAQPLSGDMQRAAELQAATRNSHAVYLAQRRELENLIASICTRIDHPGPVRIGDATVRIEHYQPPPRGPDEHYTKIVVDNGHEMQNIIDPATYLPMDSP